MWPDCTSSWNRAFIKRVNKPPPPPCPNAGPQQTMRHMNSSWSRAHIKRVNKPPSLQCPNARPEPTMRQTKSTHAGTNELGCEAALARSPTSLHPCSAQKLNLSQPMRHMNSSRNREYIKRVNKPPPLQCPNAAPQRITRPMKSTQAGTDDVNWAVKLHLLVEYCNSPRPPDYKWLNIKTECNLSISKRS